VTSLQWFREAVKRQRSERLISQALMVRQAQRQQEPLELELLQQVQPLEQQPVHLLCEFDHRLRYL
jgi:hypothetical protein